ncbi:MAG: Hsp70 family protein [Deltaproteobacteria bacterium]|nr:Hsp70 family protein [Deltaproteobacteria bacterium]
MGPVVGIDLGTSRSSVAWSSRGLCVAIPDDEGRVDHPSVVHYPAGGPAVAGHDAVPFLIDAPAHTVFAAKRLIGRAWVDPEVRAAVGARPYRVVKGDGNYPLISLHGGTVAPSAVSADVLRHLRALAERRLGVPVRRAVVAVPANFNDAQREATRVAAWQAGLEVLRLVNEPTAAALSIAPPLPDGTFLIYDFGGGTFDVTVLERSADVFRVIATGGDMALGGDDMDRAMAERIRQQFLEEHGVDLRETPSTWATLLHACERAKIALAVHDEMPVRLNHVGRRGGVPLHLSVSVTRAWLAHTVAPLVQRSLAVTREVLRAAGLAAPALDGVVMVGGTSQVPAVRAAVAAELGRPPVPGVHPTAAVALGAAALAEQVAGGAGRAGLLLDVVPQPLGLAAPDGGVVPLFARNTPVPAHAEAVVGTTRDGQRALSLSVVQGESPRAVDNVELGHLLVADLPMGAAGQVRVQVCAEMDQDGMLHVAAVDLQTGRVHGAFTRTLTGMTEAEMDALRTRARSA